MSAMKPIRFRFAPSKAYDALHWMVGHTPGIDLHTLLKGCYFADKDHLNKENRPVFGATYRAMKFGPVPLEIYEMAKSDALWLAEVGMDEFPWRLEGFHLSLKANFAPDLRHLSASDFEAIQRGLQLSEGMTFNERTAATHGSDWQAANLGVMRYEDMLDESDDKEERIAYLREAGPYMKL